MHPIIQVNNILLYLSQAIVLNWLYPKRIRTYISSPMNNINLRFWRYHLAHAA